jgi:lipopolysaccharide export system permease protein
MKKLDKLIVNAFLGPFFLTFVVVVFILLTIYLLSYIEDFIGKNLGFVVFSELIFYFSINMVPAALPLAVLLSSLMTYGNLGEHHELTAVKGSGISLLRAILPVFLIVLFLTAMAFYFNNTIVPKANLKAFSLLYDIRQKKPAIDFKEGAFYNGLPGYSIRVSKKFPDGHSLKGVMIYNHTGGRGNTDLIVADSGNMYTFNHEQYLSLELFNGTSYTEYTPGTNNLFPKDFIRNNFYKSKIVFSLASFVFNKTPEQLFASNRKMKNVSQLTADSDSLEGEYHLVKKNIVSNISPFYLYGISDAKPVNKDSARRGMLNRKDSMQIYAQNYTKIQEVEALGGKASAMAVFKKDSIEKVKTDSLNKLKNSPKEKLKQREFAQRRRRDSIIEARRLEQSAHYKNLASRPNRKGKEQTVNSLNNKGQNDTSKVNNALGPKMETIILNRAANQARSIKSATSMYLDKIDEIRREADSYKIERDRKFTQSMACLIMFLIGAPLGAIIRKGGFGFPVLISIIFFILFYVLSILGEKMAKEDILPVWVGMWMANMILFPVGLFFLKQAKNDARLFEAESYATFIKVFTKPFTFFRKKRGFN